MDNLSKYIKQKDYYDLDGFIKNIMLFVYLCIPAEVLVFTKIGLSYSASLYLTLFVLYGLYFSYCIYVHKLLAPDFWLLLFLVSCFFLVSFLFHPEYKFWYTRPEYGVWEYVLRPDNGLYIYLFLRVINKPKEILKSIRYSALVMYAYYGIAIVRAVNRGYWIDTTNTGSEIHIAYNLSIGYHLLLFTLVYIYCALENKKIIDVAGAVLGTIMILVAGSRGPFLDIGIFFIIYTLVRISNSKQKAQIIIVLSSLLVFSLAFGTRILMIISRVLNNYGVNPRFINTLIEGNIADSSSRDEIWAAALSMIKENPFGYGAMGSRPVMFQYIYVAHPHQVFLEILIDFGVLWGSIIILWLVFGSLRIFCLKNIDEWKGVYIVFFARACQLLVSLTFWHSIGIWGMMAIGSCIFLLGGKEQNG